MGSLPRFLTTKEPIAICAGECFNHWTVLSDRPKGSEYCHCRCDCGKESLVLVQYLRSGQSKQCRLCMNKGRTSPNKRHGGRGTRLYRIWSGIKTRCFNPKDRAYANYGARGITMCEEWRQDFVAFRDWALSHGYEEHLELDRTDNDGSYTPDNCRWITQVENQRNRRTTVYITAWGETKPLTSWVDDSRCIVGAQCLAQRIKKGWKPEEALQYPSSGRKASLKQSNLPEVSVITPVRAWGETKSARDWLQDPRCVVVWPTLVHRLQYGWPPEKALSHAGRKKPVSVVDNGQK